MGNLVLLASFCLAVCALWLVMARFRMKPDNSWPLPFYFVLVAYHNVYDLVMNSYVVYVAVVCALLMRFEFLNDRMLLIVRFIEMLALLHIAYSLISVILKAAA